MTAELFPISPDASGDPPLAQPPVADRQGALDALEQRYPGLWRAGQLGHLGRAGSVPALPTGHDALSAELPGGGWPVGALTELLLADPGVGELRLLRPALLALAAAQRRVALIGPPHLPNATCLAEWGLPARLLYWVRPPAGASRAAAQADVLWAAEQVLRSQAFGGVMVWLPTARPEALRRLQVLAQAGDAVVWACRPASVLRESSPAVLRLLLSPAPGNAVSVVFHKRRGPVRDTPLVLPLGEMMAVPAMATPQAPSMPVPLNAPVSQAVAGEQAHVVLDRGASAAPVAGRAAAELA
ncbi:translesion DNA synthesis-associated protein ImuA [Cupriavidus basilensis]|uniref:RecA/RadA recombinase n=1 Tax=Cupriavidus basilensis TaxID=68895 RepID=A0A0C4YM33_9BURK|nr:translesion DNA synthesis-associated protein ImuA [Cupriavidus basilensis]AJG24098.1 RecA/RadA recombinase [Cupriavidus basilensis]